MSAAAQRSVMGEALSPGREGGSIGGTLVDAPYYHTFRENLENICNDSEG